jgi:hypothetical protein
MMSPEFELKVVVMPQSLRESETLRYPLQPIEPSEKVAAQREIHEGVL